MSAERRMWVGAARVVLRVAGADSLKAKRRVIQSILDRARARARVAAAEIDHLEDHRQAGLGFACVANDGTHVRRLLQAVIQEIERNPAVEVIEASVEVY
ncbi:MAG TPA: DUF503 domain-containing protein [Limnochordia bacterium]